MAAATVPQVDIRQDSTATWSAEAIVCLGRSIYERDLRTYLESKEPGRYVAINVLTTSSFRRRKAHDGHSS